MRLNLPLVGTSDLFDLLSCYLPGWLQRRVLPTAFHRRRGARLERRPTLAHPLAGSAGLPHLLLPLVAHERSAGRRYAQLMLPPHRRCCTSVGGAWRAAFTTSPCLNLAAATV